MLHYSIAVAYLILVDLFKKKIFEKGEPWLIAASVGCSSVFLFFVIILGVVLHRKFQKKSRRVNVAPSRNSVIDRDRGASNNSWRGNMNREPTIVSQVNLIDNEVKAVSKSPRLENIGLNSEYETIFPLPGRPIKPSTYPRREKPPRKPRRHEAPVMGSNAALPQAATGAVIKDRVKDGSGYLEVTESDGATYLTIVDATVRPVPASPSEPGDGYLEMDNLNNQGDPVYLSMQENQVDPVYLPMHGDASQAVYTSMTKGDFEEDYINMKNSEGYVNVNEAEGGYVNVPGQGIGQTGVAQQTTDTQEQASSDFKTARALVAESFRMRTRSGSRDPEYSVMRNTGRAHSDAYYISIKPDGRISWASDDDGYLRARYPSESEGALPSPMAIAHPNSRTHENAYKPWEF